MIIDPFIDTWTEMSLYVIITANEGVFGLTNHKAAVFWEIVK